MPVSYLCLKNYCMLCLPLLHFCCPKEYVQKCSLIQEKDEKYLENSQISLDQIIAGWIWDANTHTLTHIYMYILYATKILLLLLIDNFVATLTWINWANYSRLAKNTAPFHWLFWHNPQKKHLCVHITF